MNYIGPLGPAIAISRSVRERLGSRTLGWNRNTMWKRTLSACCAAVLLVTSAAYAQDRATLTLRSGERVSGQLVDLGGIGYTVGVNGIERQIPQNDVSVIDFTGGTMSDADWAKFSGTSQVVLRSGQTFDGSLYDISGTTPLKLTIRTSTGERQVASSDVARIVMSRPEAAVGTSGTNPAVTATASASDPITVQANQPWTATGITVRKGQTVTLSTSGEIQLSANVNDVAGPGGSKTGRTAANAPFPKAPAGALIGRIGPNGGIFSIGASTSFVMPADGVLFLGINDDSFADNRGNFQVVIG